MALFPLLDSETAGVISLCQLEEGIARLETETNFKPAGLLWYFSLNPSGNTLSKVKEAAERAVEACMQEEEVDLWKLRSQAA